VMKNIKKPKVFDVPPLDYIAMSTAHELKKSKKRCEKKIAFRRFSTVQEEMQFKLNNSLPESEITKSNGAEWQCDGGDTTASPNTSSASVRRLDGP